MVPHTACWLSLVVVQCVQRLAYMRHRSSHLFAAKFSVGNLVELEASCIRAFHLSDVHQYVQAKFEVGHHVERLGGGKYSLTLDAQPVGLISSAGVQFHHPTFPPGVQSMKRCGDGCFRYTIEVWGEVPVVFHLKFANGARESLPHRYDLENANRGGTYVYKLQGSTVVSMGAIL